MYGCDLCKTLLRYLLKEVVLQVYMGVLSTSLIYFSVRFYFKLGRAYFKCFEYFITNLLL